MFIIIPISKSIFILCLLFLHKDVIHTVGPIGKNEEALKSCYENCLRLALENKVRTLVSRYCLGVPVVKWELFETMHRARASLEKSLNLILV